MDVITGIVLICGMATVIASVYLWVRYQAMASQELEEFRQSKISERAQNRPVEWWQEILINLSKNPEVIDKLLPMVGNVNLQGLVQSAIQNQLKR